MIYNHWPVSRFLITPPPFIDSEALIKRLAKRPLLDSFVAPMTAKAVGLNTALYNPIPSVILIALFLCAIGILLITALLIGISSDSCLFMSLTPSGEFFSMASFNSL